VYLWYPFSFFWAVMCSDVTVGQCYTNIHFTCRWRQHGPPKHWSHHNTTRHHKPEDRDLKLHRHEYFKYHIFVMRFLNNFHINSSHYVMAVKSKGKYVFIAISMFFFKFNNYPIKVAYFSKISVLSTKRLLSLISSTVCYVGINDGIKLKEYKVRMSCFMKIHIFFRKFLG
jgi:hypothetical protein